jgi:hypothetical protein
MSFVIPFDVLQATKHKEFARTRDRISEMTPGRNDDREFELDLSEYDDVILADLLKAAEDVENTRVARATKSIMQARKGDDGIKIPNFAAFKGMLLPFLKKGAFDAWIYVRRDDGRVYPELVTGVRVNEGNRYSPEPMVIISTLYFGYDGNGILTTCKDSYSFGPSDVANKTIAQALLGKEICRETKELRKQYDVEMARFNKVVAPAFAKQFRMSGKPIRVLEGENSIRAYIGAAFDGTRVINDYCVSEGGTQKLDCESEVMEDREGGCAVPVHPVVAVFDLNKHVYYWTHSENLTPYVYDKGLRSKLILPPSHRDLLDILTTDIEAFTQDLVEGKSSGNVILAKGPSGLGKTMTAEVYSELREMPLYKVRAGTLGTTAEEISKALDVVFERVIRWGCLLLLDEADVFVTVRKDDLQKNAIVAEFLRVLEIYSFLFFMTTNLPGDIDDAIISRCVIVLDYVYPDKENLARVWRVMAELNETKLSEKLITELVELFPQIAPRDVKQLFRLTLRVALAKKEKITIDVFRKCGILRGHKASQGKLEKSSANKK